MSTEVNSFKLDAAMYDGYYAQKFLNDATERFHLVKPLGKGRYGEVWKVQEINGAERVRALKTVKVKAGHGLETNEVKSLIALNQYERHFTRFYGWWSTGVHLYLVTELMKGGDLKRIIGNGPKFLTENQAKTIAKKILEATAIMHSRGIIHQDLKPSNILLADEDPQLLDIRIADMGISRTAGNLPESSDDRKNNPEGTWGYMAPEVVKYLQQALAAKSTAKGDEAVQRKPEEHSNPITDPDDTFTDLDDISTDPADLITDPADPITGLADAITYSADLWSVGCVIFATLTGHSPYPGDKLVVSDDYFPGEMLEYNEVSDLGIQFIMQLVKVASKERMSAEVALDHPWLLGA